MCMSVYVMKSLQRQPITPTTTTTTTPPTEQQERMETLLTALYECLLREDDWTIVHETLNSLVSHSLINRLE
jgi:hypothetical protein